MTASRWEIRRLRPFSSFSSSLEQMIDMLDWRKKLYRFNSDKHVRFRQDFLFSFCCLDELTNSVFNVDFFTEGSSTKQIYIEMCLCAFVCVCICAFLFFFFLLFNKQGKYNANMSVFDDEKEERKKNDERRTRIRIVESRSKSVHRHMHLGSIICLEGV